MRHLLSLFLCLALCGACGGESDDGGSGTDGGGAGGASGATSDGTGGYGWGASGGSSSGGGPSCSCPEGSVCTVWCQGNGKIFKQECVPTPEPDAGCSGLCGTDYPWSCGFASCNDAPIGAKICMGA
jgi:hypothetical protein